MAGRRIHVATACALLLSCASGARAAAPAAAPPPLGTSITIDGTAGGRVFDGIGALSAGANSRLLVDYPAAQRAQVLDLLFTPGRGAALQILKVEIGGDTNSTDGSESSIEPVKGAVTCGTGYEWWLMAQAKARNPNIRLYAEAWGGPGWVGEGSNTLNTDSGINYLVSWLGCARHNGLKIDYVGGWNERDYDLAWYGRLRTALDAHGFGGVSIVGGDIIEWNGIDALLAPGLAKVLPIIGSHYPCQGGDGGYAFSCAAPPEAVYSGRRLWASENGSLPSSAGAAEMVRTINRGYIDGRLTASINWPLVGAIYGNESYATTGLVLANQPWSGNYSVGAEVWATAQYTHFMAPGWRYVDSAIGYLDGAEVNGSFVTLRQGDRAYTSVIETTTASAAQVLHFRVGGGLPTGTVHVYGTDLRSSDHASWFTHVGDVTPRGGAYSFTAKPGWIYTVSTLSSATKPKTIDPARAPLALPYVDNFEGEPIGSAPRYLANQQGDFQIRDCAGGRSGRCVRQMTPAAPVTWDAPSFPYATLGDLGWTDYTVSSDVLLQQPGYAQLLGRVGAQATSAPANVNAYALRVADTGEWSIVRLARSAPEVTLASGATSALGTSRWHRLALTLSGPALTATLDGHLLGSASDASYTRGQAGIGTGGYETDEFDNLAVTGAQPQPRVSGDSGG